MARRKRFSENSKVLTLRVPFSRYDELKAKLNFIIDSNDKGDDFPFQNLSIQAFNEIDNLLLSIQKVIKENGSLSATDFNYLIEHTDFSYNKKVREFIKA